MSAGRLGPVLRQFGRALGAGGLAERSDRELLEQFARDRDEGAFAVLVERHGGMVLAVCRGVLGDAHDAEDAFQATWLVLAAKAAAVRWRESVGGWLHATAHRVAYKARARSARRHNQERPMGAEAEAGTAVDGERRELLALLQAEVARLPEKYRGPLVLCYLEGKTHAQAARELGCPLGSMSKRLARGCELLRCRLGGRGAALSAGAVAALLGGEAAAAPEGLRSAAVRAAMLLAAGRSAAGAAPAPVAALAEGVLRDMSLRSFKITMMLVLTVCLSGVSAGALAWRLTAGEPRGPERPARAPAPAKEKAPAEARTFRSPLPLQVWQIVEGQTAPKYLGATGPLANTPVRVPAGADWYVQPVVGLGGALGIGGGVLGALGGGGIGGLGALGGQLGGFGNLGGLGNLGGQFGLQGGIPPAGGALGALGIGGGALGMPGVGALGVGGGALGALGGGLGVMGGGGLGMPGSVGFGPKLTGRPLQRLVSQLRRKEVPGLAVANMTFTGADLAELREAPELEILLLREVQIGDADLKHLECMRSLHTLGLEETAITEAGLKHLEGLRALTTLRLAGMKIADHAMSEMRDLPHLRSLRLSDTGVGAKGLAALRDLRHLETLELDGDFTDKELATLNALGGLKALRLHRTELTDAGLGRLKGLRKLKALALDSRFGWDGPRYELVGDNPPRCLLPGQEEDVDSVSEDISDAGLAHLAAFPALTDLHLVSGKVTDAGMPRLNALKHLRRLTLFTPAVTDKGVARLAALKSLEVLDLRGVRLTPAGAKALRALPRLKVVYVPAPPEENDPAADADSGLKQFRRALPGVDVRPLATESEEALPLTNKNLGLDEHR
jgi:RNA polymerase sigma factor (sigma-70 family)